MKTSTADNPPVNWALLAGLRGLLALQVLITHCSDFDLAPWMTPIMQLDAAASVAAFLILSGYSIRHSITRQPEHYVERRINRIFPVYLVALILAVVPFLIGGPVINYPQGGAVEMPDIWGFLAHLFLLQNITVPVMITLAASWTLAIEWVFYMLAPLLVKTSRRTLWVLTACGFVFFIASPWIASGSPGPPWGIIVTPGPWGVIGLGCFWLLGWLMYEGRSEFERLAYVLTPVVAISAQQSVYHYNYLAALTVVLAPLGILYGGHLVLSQRVKKFALWAGDLSYPAYILHQPVYWTAFVATGITNALALSFISITVSMAVLHMVDTPMRKRGQRQLAPAPGAT